MDRKKFWPSGLSFFFLAPFYKVLDTVYSATGFKSFDAALPHGPLSHGSVNEETARWTAHWEVSGILDWLGAHATNYQLITAAGAGALSILFGPILVRASFQLAMRGMRLLGN